MHRSKHKKVNKKYTTIYLKIFLFKT